MARLPTLHRKARFILWIATASVLFVGMMIWLLLLRGQRILEHDGVLIGGWIALGAIVILIAALLCTTPADAIRLSDRRSAQIVVGGSIILHLMALLWLMPALSEDAMRYRLDGRMWLSGVSPYASTPQEFLERHNSSTDSLDGLVTFPYLATIYPPTAQLVFIAARAIEDRLPIRAVDLHGASDWRSALPLMPTLRQAMVLRIIFVAASILSLCLLMQLLRDGGRSIWWAALFGWHPLVIIETAGVGHQDIVGVALLLNALLLSSRRACVALAIVLALASGLKPQAVLLAPFFFREIAAPRDRRRFVIVIIATLLLVYLPAMLYQHGYHGWFATVRTYSQSWEANGSIYELFKYLFGRGDDGWSMQRAKDASRWFALAMLLLIALILWLRRASPAAAGYWLFLVMLLCSPVVYPWYLLWPLCLVPLVSDAGGTTALVWAATAGICYRLWHLPAWDLPARWLLSEYVPVYAALAIELIRISRRYKPADDPSSRELAPS